MVFTSDNEGTENESVNFKVIEVDEVWLKYKYFFLSFLYLFSFISNLNNKRDAG